MKLPFQLLPAAIGASLFTGVHSAAIFPLSGLSTRLVTRADGSNASVGLGSAKLKLVQQLLNSTATESWEIGTHAQALTEYLYPALSPFSSNSLPPPSSPIAYEVLSIAARIVSTKPSGILQLVQDGSAADPASIGVSVVLANWTSNGVGLNVTQAGFAEAAKEQATSLLEDTPRSSSGAISHRTADVELWSDFIYMAPPFLAYYGVLTSNQTTIQSAYDQCRLYRSALLNSTAGLWSHIVDGSSADPGLWATGNGWAAAGMMRVYATILRSSYASEFDSQLKDLLSWSTEIVNGAFGLQQKNYLFPNYFSSNTTQFSDASSTALLTSVYYRILFLSPSSSSSLPALSKVESSRGAVYSAVSSSTGVLSPVVDPLKYSQEGTESPEGEAFVLLMESAWRDYYESTNGAGSTNETTPAATKGAAMGGGLGSATRWSVVATILMGAAMLY
ncbi:hypothetical protein P7C70_g5487, partial [Phenoliferia sp. Uapishka_3]